MPNFMKIIPIGVWLYHVDAQRQAGRQAGRQA